MLARGTFTASRAEVQRNRTAMREASFDLGTYGVTARVDRVQILSSAEPGQRPPKAINGFDIETDTFVRMQTTVPTYARSRRYRSTTNDAQIFWQYERKQPWLEPWKITMAPDDRTGLSRGEIEAVVEHCKCWRFLLVELAIDFNLECRVDRKFVKRHGIFGKSHITTKNK